LIKVVVIEIQAPSINHSTFQFDSIRFDSIDRIPLSSQ
jgi:hypothetical protein